MKCDRRHGRMAAWGGVPENGSNPFRKLPRPMQMVLGRFGSEAPIEAYSRIAAIQESLRRPRIQAGKLSQYDANGRPHQTHRSPRPCPDCPSPAPSSDFAATPQRFPEIHAAQGSARFGSIRNGPATPAATARPWVSRFATRPAPQHCRHGKILAAHRRCGVADR